MDRSEISISEPDYGAEGVVASVLGITQDVTELQQRLSQAETNAADYDIIGRSLYSSSPIMMGVVELRENDLREISDHRNAGVLFGKTPNMTQGRLAGGWEVPPEYIQMWIDAYHSSERSLAPCRFEYPHETSAGIRWLSVTICPVTRASEKVLRFSYLVEDVTERKRLDKEMQAINTWLKEANAHMMKHITLNRQHAVELTRQKVALEEANTVLAHLAMTDSLTGLKNHRAFLECLTDELKRGSRYYVPISILMIDVDHFKQFNDTYGHLAGDQVLRQIAYLLEACVRDTDTVARYGGEEFVILMPHTDTPTASIAAERLRNAITGAHWDHYAITVSIGVAALRMDDERPESLIQRADQALYCSKADGRNRVTCG